MSHVFDTGPISYEPLPSASLSHDVYLRTEESGSRIYERRARKLGDNGHGQILWFEYSKEVGYRDVFGNVRGK